MLRLILVPAVFLLAAKVMTSSAEKCNLVTHNTCSQHCNMSSCHCGGTEQNLIYKKCNQACGSTNCKKITCSSGTCYQKCHNCHMECTSDVDYCEQRCLSGACSFKCNAKRCVRKCTSENCRQATSAGPHQSPLPRTYLATLAGLFAAMTVLTCLALVLSIKETKCRPRRGKYDKLKRFSGTDASFNSLAPLVTQSVVTQSGETFTSEPIKTTYIVSIAFLFERFGTKEKYVRVTQKLIELV